VPRLAHDDGSNLSILTEERGMRRPSLELVVNNLLAVTCLVVLSTYGYNWYARVNPPQTPSPLTVGRIPPGVTGVEWSDKNVVVFARSTCRYCTDSMPFYLTLSKQTKAARGRFVAVGEESVDVIRSYFQSYGISPDEVVSRPTRDTRVMVTPTLAVLDSGGRTIDSWVGKLSPSTETRVTAMLASR
jgi:hypothetical protein